MIKILSLIFTVASSFLSCNDSTTTANQAASVMHSKSELPVTTTEIDRNRLGYNLTNPDETFSLTTELREISGLGLSDDGAFLYAVQDENGTIFKLDKKTGAILEKIKFHKDGDYEGIEIVGDKIYVVKSTGTVYEVINPGQKGQQLKKFNSFLSRENDVEGLAFDEKNNRLLLACKGLPATGESFEIARFKKVIYEFDLTTKVLNPEPIYTIQLETIRNYLEQNKALAEYEKLVEFFSAGKENLTFNPSAIAIHPLTKDIYVSSSNGKVLGVLNQNGDLIYIEKLKKKVHIQPEGMVFGKDGTLYISNEGKSGKAKIHRFDYKKH